MDEIPTATAPPANRNIRVFMVYHDHDLDAVKTLSQAFRQWNIDLWLADDILPGADWEAAYRQGVLAADFCLACFSSQTVNQRGKHQKFIKIALDLFLERLSDDIYFIPVRLDDCDPPPDFRRFRPADGFTEEGWERLLAAMRLGAEKYGLTLQPRPTATPGARYAAGGWPFSCRNQSQVRYFIEIDARDGGYAGRIHQGDREKCYPREAFRLGPEDTVTVKETKITWRRIVQAIIDFDVEWLRVWFDERGQYEIGSALFRQAFGELKLSEVQPDSGETEVRIITEDEHIARLPWPLLASRGAFLTTTGWSAAVSLDDRVKDAELPPSPSLLVIAPQPQAAPETHAAAHLAELRQLLCDSQPAYQDDRKFRVVRRWAELKAALQETAWPLLYFYGHGRGDRYRSRLVWEDSEGRPEERPAADLGVLLRTAAHGAPQLAYINCCQGDAGGLLGVGVQLSHVCPATLTNRTIAYVSAARAQALEFWHGIIIKGLAPHTAAARLTRQVSALELSLADPRWMTPVLHCRYDRWLSHPPKAAPRLERDPHWRWKLDRIAQFSRVYLQTSEMLLERKPKILAYLWYGTPQQGVDIFHQRLKVDLQEKLDKVVLYERAPDWPPFSDYETHGDQNFETMMRQAFQTRDLREIPQRIRDYAAASDKKLTLVYLRHRPVESVHTFDPKHLRRYYIWLHNEFIKYLPENAHLLVGVSFVVAEPKKFHKLIAEKDRLPSINLAHLVFQLLDEMERVTDDEIRMFVKTHRLLIPPEILERELNNITSGKTYEKILDRLIALEARLMRNDEKSAPDPTDTEAEEGYEGVF